MKLKFSVLSISLVFTYQYLSAQNNGFPSGEVSKADLLMAKYPLDSTASAVVLNEFGEAYFDSEDGALVLEYHEKLKVLNKDGLRYGDFRIPIRQTETDKDQVSVLEASTYNFVHGEVVKKSLSNKDIFFEKNPKGLDFAKFTLPNVQVGSILEVRYTIKTPFIFNFWPWQFQREIPKRYSEFWARIRANYTYSISLRGFLNLTKNETSLQRECFTYGSAKADCSLFKFAIKDIPAFRQEDYMTAKENFISAVSFELSEIRYFDGRVDKVTKEWKDVEEELMQHEEFGSQLRKAKALTEDAVKELIGTETSQEAQGRKIYSWIQNSFLWNENESKYTELGAKKAFESKSGNVSDINLLLLAALQNAGLEAYPVILSTRENGLPATVFPVLSEYNYVVVYLKIGETFFLLDGTDRFIAFGLLPMRCINGSARLLAKKNSRAIDLTTAVKGKQKRYTSINLKLSESGNFSGNVQTTYSEYDAASQRKSIFEAGKDNYIRKFEKNFETATVSNVILQNLDEVEKPLIEKFSLEISSSQQNPQQIYFNPFLNDRWKNNPFKSNERLYPVDFGAPIQQTTSITIELPSNYKLDGTPSTIGLGLPNDGGKYLIATNNSDKSLTLRSTILLNKAIYSSQEYHYLKELFGRIVETQQTDLVFVKK